MQKYKTWRDFFLGILYLNLPTHPIDIVPAITTPEENAPEYPLIPLQGNLRLGTIYALFVHQVFDGAVEDWL